MDFSLELSRLSEPECCPAAFSSFDALAGDVLASA
jgi:hypothetical protein